MKMKNIIVSIVMIFTMFSLSNAKEILVAISPIRPPFMYIDEKGEIAGYDPEIARTILKKLGHTVKFVNMEFSGLIPSLTTGKVDLVVSGLTINDERKKVIDFSENYNETGSRVFVMEGDKYKSLKDLKGKKVGAELGTVQADYVNENAEKYGYEVVIFNAANEMFLDLVKKGGGVDAIVENQTLAQEYAKKQKVKIKSISDLVKPSKFGIGIAKGNEKFLKEINDVLKEMKKSGEQKKIHKKYFK
ncbi:MAG: transporter substrate-binding domain-containing protein [Rickettsiales bacterium]|jgi:polar amino acid transport system substrate-binding protein|nr:transporter substrate-binding domain-containing protein [Rickettsiales bacterium]